MQETHFRSQGWEDSPGEENESPLQYCCLEDSMDRGAWQATVHEVSKIRQSLVTKPPHHYVSEKNRKQIDYVSSSWSSVYWETDIIQKYIKINIFYLVWNAVKEEHMVQRGQWVWWLPKARTFTRRPYWWDFLFSLFWVAWGWGKGLLKVWLGTLEREMSCRQLNSQLRREAGLGVSNTEEDWSPHQRAQMRSFTDDV